MVTQASPQVAALRRRAVGGLVATVFALASTAPLYSLAVTVGLVAALVGGLAPVLLVVGAVPVVLVVLCFRELNEAEPDCGTCYAWTARAFGPIVGWLTGWVTIAACVLVVCNLMQAAAIYTYTVFGADHFAASPVAQASLGLALLAGMTYLAHRGITIAARTQVLLFAAELVVLVVFTIAALLADPLPVQPLPATGGPDAGAIATAFLVAVFLYWGWDSAFAVNEESIDPTGTPGRSALTAMAALVLIYGGATAALITWAGAGRLAAIGDGDVSSDLGAALLGSAGGTALAGAILVSALACVQTTILPASRSAFSMARRGTLPPLLARVSRRGSPSVATWGLAGLTAVVYVGLLLTSDAVLADSVAATAVLVALYYTVTCLAVPFVFRGNATARPVRRIVVPVIATVVFGCVLAMSLLDLARASVFAVIAVVGVGTAVLLVHPPARRNTMSPGRRNDP